MMRSSTHFMPNPDACSDMNISMYTDVMAPTGISSVYRSRMNCGTQYAGELIYRFIQSMSVSVFMSVPAGAFGSCICVVEVHDCPNDVRYRQLATPPGALSWSSTTPMRVITIMTMTTVEIA